MSSEKGLGNLRRIPPGSQQRDMENRLGSGGDATAGVVRVTGQSGSSGAAGDNINSMSGSSVKTECKLPGKLETPGGRYNPASIFNVRGNGYLLQTRNALEKVNVCQIKFIGITKRNEERDLSRGAPGDYEASLRRKNLWKLFQLLVQREKCFFPDKYYLYFDRGCQLYSPYELADVGAEPIIWDLELDELGSLREMFEDRCQKIQVRLIATGSVQLHDISAIDTNPQERERSLVQFMEVATSQMLFKEGTHLVYGRKAFNRLDKPGNTVDLHKGVVLAKGFQKNVRYVGNSIDEAALMVQIDSKRGAFFKDGPLVNFVMAVMDARDERALSDGLYHPGFSRQLLRTIKGLTVTTIHLKRQRSFKIFAISEESANDVKVAVDDGTTLSVVEYFNVKYGQRLRFPNYPVIIERKPSPQGPIDSFHPMEVLRIAPGQRVPLKKQSAEVTQSLIKESAMLPTMRMEENEQNRKQAFLGNDNKYLANLKVEVQKCQILSEAQQLHPPAILYSGGQQRVEVNLQNPQWKMGNHQSFFMPAVAPNVWVVCIFDRQLGNDVNRFMERFVNKCRQRGITGMQMPTRSELLESVDLGYISGRMKFFKEQNATFVFFVTKQKMDPVHATIKLCEQKYSLTTQHVHMATVNKALGHQGAEMVLDNITMKTNGKLGGVSHSLSTGNSFLVDNPRVNSDLVANYLLGGNRMFFGLAWSHPAPLTLRERRLEIGPMEPSIVGLSYTTGKDATDLRGTYWFQTPRQTNMSTTIVEMLVGALKCYIRRNQKLPEHLVFFWGGVSEGEFSVIVESEQATIRQAFAKAGGPQYSPSLTIICVQSRANYRLFKEQIDNRGRAPEQNVPAGTCIDKDIVHPTQCEWITVPHRAIQGTACPIKCTLLVDDSRPRISLDELEMITNSLCYGHGIVCSPTRIPCVLYGAMELSKRGRNNWKEFTASGTSHSSGNQAHNQALGDDKYLAQLNDELSPKIDSKFWA